MVANLDLGATIPVWAGLPSDPNSDGWSLVELLENPGAPWPRTEFLIESFSSGAGPGNPDVWAGLRTREVAAGGQVEEFKYVEYGATDEQEFYVLHTDQVETQSEHNTPAWQPKIQLLAQRLASLKGLAITTPPDPPVGTVGEAYYYALEVWGGRPPYTWRVATDLEGSLGGLPPGLTLDPLSDGNAAVRGTPTQAGCFPVWLAVRGTACRPSSAGSPRSMSWPSRSEFGPRPTRLRRAEPC